MSHNTFGHLFRVTTFGESHGIAIGCVVDGCPPLIPLTNEDIQHDLDRRRPGQSRFTTQRQEPDAVKILSGVMAHPETGVQVTTGTPIALLIENTDQRSKDYSEIKDKFRPGHADYTYWAKYGIRDYRGGGRSSARETAMRVAAGAIARKIIPGITIRGALVQMGPHRIDRTLGLLGIHLPSHGGHDRCTGHNSPQHKTRKHVPTPTLLSRGRSPSLPAAYHTNRGNIGAASLVKSERSQEIFTTIRPRTCPVRILAPAPITSPKPIS